MSTYVYPFLPISGPVGSADANPRARRAVEAHVYIHGDPRHHWRRGVAANHSVAAGQKERVLQPAGLQQFLD